MGADEAKRIRDGEKENMRKAAWRIGLAVWLAVAGASVFPQETMKNQALEALRAGDFTKVIRLCQDALRTSPDDEEFRFLMSRAYAYHGDYDWALQTLEPLIKRSPKNTDYLLHRARIEFWRGNAAAAKEGFEEVLKIAPQNPEGLAGLARIAAGKGDYSVAERYYLGSLAQNPNDAETHYALGLLYRWQGDFEKARASFLRARRLDPSNSEYKKAATRVPGRSESKYELRVIYQPETFTDGRTTFQSGQAAFMWRLPKNGPALIFKGDRTHRFGLWDDQFGLEAYPRLWKGASAYLDVNFSPGGAALYPRASYLAEVYQALSGAWDASIGYRFMDFESNPVSIYFGSLGLYSGPFYSCIRVYFSPESRESKISWLFLTRWYFDDRNYLFGGYGQGTRSMEIAAAGDLDFKDVQTMLAGFDVTVFRRIHILGSFSRLNDRGVGRNTWLIGAGYKWGE
jgi:YaiO family outer membrane protein